MNKFVYCKVLKFLIIKEFNAAKEKKEFVFDISLWRVSTIIEENLFEKIKDLSTIAAEDLTLCGMIARTRSNAVRSFAVIASLIS